MAGKLDNPFVGPRPLSREEKIHGRTEEIAELDYLLGAQRIVLLHSPSGAGKSSLVNAGLVPRVQKRFDVWGPTRVNLEPGIAVANRYVFSAAMGFEQDIPEQSGRRRPDHELAQQSLKEYVAGRPRRKNAPESILLIFDQFEEILTVDPVDIAAKHEFFAQLGELLHDPTIWALCVSREDYLAPLDPYAQHVPTHLLNRFRIDRLDIEHAGEVMVRTAEQSGPGGRRFVPAAVEKLVSDLATVKVQQADGKFVEQQGRYVEPVQLQVVCRGLWDRMSPKNLQIDLGAIEAYGNVSTALSTYYAESLARATKGNTADERAIREWFNDKLITAGGIRGQVLREETQSGGLDNTLVDTLRDSHLLRPERRGGATWFELAHDRLVDPVRKDNEGWFDQHLGALQRQASIWDKQQRPESLLFLGLDLEEAEQWAAGNRSLVTASDSSFLEASVAKQKIIDRERKQTIRIKRIAIVAGLLFVVSLLAAGWAIQKSVEADVQAHNAKQLARNVEQLARRARAVEMQRLGPNFPFLMPIEDVFSIAGRGIVVTGRVDRGRAKAGDEVEIVGLGETRTSVITGIERFKKLLDEAVVGDDNVGLLLRGLEKGDVQRGQVVAKAGTITAHTRFVGEVFLLTKDEGGRSTPFFDGYRPQFFFRTTDITGVVKLPKGTEKMVPVDTVVLQVQLVSPVAMERGLQFEVREGARRVGIGVVTKILE